MDAYPGIAADPGCDSRPLLTATSLSRRGLWESHLDRLVAEVERLEAEVERLRALLLNGYITESKSTEVLVQFEVTRERKA